MGLTIFELVALTALLTFGGKLLVMGWRSTRAALKTIRERVVAFIKAQFSAVMAKLDAQDEMLGTHSLKIDALSKRIETLEQKVENGCGSDGHVIREASEKLEAAAVESTKAARTLTEIAIKFSSDKQKDFGKVIVKE